MFFFVFMHVTINLNLSMICTCKGLAVKIINLIHAITQKTDASRICKLKKKEFSSNNIESKEALNKL
jgi:hypothetical protein